MTGTPRGPAVLAVVAIVLCVAALVMLGAKP